MQRITEHVEELHKSIVIALELGINQVTIKSPLISPRRVQSAEQIGLLEVRWTIVAQKLNDRQMDG